ncbi:MAG: DNA translocase FtsK, partial [Bacteroidales bacterium]|nr:DNA translocase FtsK [Bacteroidales bacterium]
ATFITLAFISYFFTWKSDQSFEWSKVISTSEIIVDNWAGKTGARIANLFIYKWFGLTSFLLPFILFILGFKLLGIRLLPLGKTTRISFIAIILFSITFGYLWGDANGILGSGIGGTYGFQISKWLNALIGKTGTGFLLLVCIFAFIVFSFDKSFFFISRIIRNLFIKNIDADIQEDDIEPELNQQDDDEINFTVTEKDKELITEDNDDEIDFERLNFEKNKQINENDIELTIEQKKDDDFLTDINTKTEELKDFDPTLELSTYKLPTLELLEDHKSEDSTVSKDELISNKNKIVETLANYKIEIIKIKATIGPTVTLYEIVPAPGIRISKIKNLEDDIALSLSALGIRIIAPIPGKGTIGIEVPNQHPEIVSMKSILASQKFQETKYDLAIALGKTISNEVFVFDLAKMPHLLVAGATGQGKSVGLNAIMSSLLYKKHPAQIKFILIDPKKVELTLYSRIEKHFLAKLPDMEEPIITDTQKVIYTLNSLCIEMDQRYDLMKAAHVRNIKEYNTKFIKRKLNPEEGHRYLPYIILVVDEFADLIMTAGREIEMPLARLAQLSRAIGIHLIIATQRPTTNIITGVIKANFPARIAFRVTSMVDSRTILDSPGANQLVGRGDMLICPGSDLIRIQCAFIDTPEIERIVDFISSQKGYPNAFLLPEYVDESAPDLTDVDLQKRDSLFEEAARLVVIHQQGSTSLIQRKFSIGYNRAGRIIDQLEAAGIVGPFEGSKARQVLFVDEYSLEQHLNNLEEQIN